MYIGLKNGYWNGSYSMLGSIVDGINVSCLPEETDIIKKMFYIPTNELIQVEVSRTPIYGIFVNVDSETNLIVTYKTRIVNEVEESYPTIEIDGVETEIDSSRVIIKIYNSVTNEPTDIEYTEGMELPIIDYDIVYKNVINTTWTFDETAYNEYLLEESNKTPTLTSEEKLETLKTELETVNTKLQEVDETNSKMLLQIATMMVGE